MVRIAFVDQTGDSAGGAQESFALLLQHLPAWVEPHVVLFHDGPYAQRLRGHGLDVTIVPVSGEVDGLRRENGLAAGALAAPRLILHLARWLKSRKITVAYTHTVKAHFLAAPAARLAGIPCVMHLRDILEGRALTALRSVSSLCSKERIAISHAVAQAYALPRTTVIFNPVDVGNFSALPAREEACAKWDIPFDPQAAYIGIVGRVNRWKGHDRFLRIASAIAGRFNTRFVVAGSPIFRDEDFLPDLQRQAAALGIGGRVHFIPWAQDVRSVYALLDVHCNCSSREPFGRTIVEAAAAGVPTVCFADAGAAEVLVDGVDGRIVPAGDENEFARALAAMLEDPSRLQTMGEAARIMAFRFHPAAHAKAVMQVVERIAA